MKKSILALSTVLFLGGCSGGGTFDLTQTPLKVEESKGIEAALEWCDQRDSDVFAVGGVRTVVGGLVDVASFIATIPVAFAIGGSVIEGSTAVRDKECKEIREFESN